MSNTLVQGVASLATEIGTSIKGVKKDLGQVGTLQTDDKTSLVGAVNELKAKGDTTSASIGIASQLLTENKTTLVGAVNELKAGVDAAQSGTSKIGDVSTLSTTSKDSVVAAINEVKQEVSALTAAGSTSIADDNKSGATTYSSNKIEDLITAAKAEVKSELVNGADSALDTFKEVAAQLQNDQTVATALATQVGLRLRIDEVVQLTPQQKTNVETSLNIGDTNTDFVARFNAALTAE